MEQIRNKLALKEWFLFF